MAVKFGETNCLVWFVLLQAEMQALMLLLCASDILFQRAEIPGLQVLCVAILQTTTTSGSDATFAHTNPTG